MNPRQHRQPAWNSRHVRNARLYAQWLKGVRQVDLARQEGITPERIRQILHREHRRLYGSSAPFLRTHTGPLREPPRPGGWLGNREV